jgi:primosomal protein N' (replication factor Y)
VLAKVAILRPVETLFDYVVPAHLEELVRVGSRVWAPFGARPAEGVVTALSPGAPPSGARGLRAIARLVDEATIPAALVELAAWISDYYLAPPGEVMRLLLPASGRAALRRTARLSDEGRRAAAALAAALPSAEEAARLEGLSPTARRALAQLGGAAGGAVDAARLPEAGVRALAAAGLVTVDEEMRTRAAESEALLRVARPLGDGELARAPKQRAIYDAIAAAGEGGISVEALRANEPRAADLARALAKAGLVSVERREVRRDPFAGRPVEGVTPPPLTPAQERAVGRLTNALDENRYAPFLLQGVTGSGKTEVYLRLIDAALARGRQALVLVPEISLTPQLGARFRGRFGDRVAILHSGLTDAERAAAYRRIQRGEVAIALGARSAVFAPLERLGVVVVDEEHDPSFKQQDGVRYHGRDVAMRRARAAGAVAVLGSATPSLETWHAAQAGRLERLVLPERANARPMPSVEVIDLRQHKLPEASLLSAPLAQAIAETLAFGEQAILFLNRRGFSTFILCRTCGKGQRCRDCSVTLTYHRGIDRVVCHYCGFRAAPPTECGACGGRALERLGAGTEHAEAEVQARFPSARVARLDRDTAEGRGLTRILDGMRAREIDIVVGTQMITKGHDFPGVTLVGVLLADHGMGLPDFRASERTYQLLEQVAGRAGRGDRAGRVLVQTYQPEHPAIVAAREHAYERFVEGELAARVELGYPPAARAACVHIDGADPMGVREAAEAVARACRTAAARAPAGEGVTVLGPAEAPLGRLRGRTRWQVFVTARSPSSLRVLGRAAMRAVEAAGRAGRVRVAVDVDPTSLL